MCENAYLSIKNPKASRALKQALDPCRRMLASLARLRFAMSATFGLRSWGPPLTKSWIRTCVERNYDITTSGKRMDPLLLYLQHVSNIHVQPRMYTSVLSTHLMHHSVLITDVYTRRDTHPWFSSIKCVQLLLCKHLKASLPSVNQVAGR